MFAVLWIVSRGWQRRKNFYVRAILCFAAFCAIRFVCFNVLFPLASQPLYNTLRMTGFIAIFILLGVVMFICFDIDFWRNLFCINMAYCTQHIAVRIYAVIENAWGTELVNWCILIFIGCVALTSVILYAAMRKLRLTKIVIANKGLLLVSTFIVATSIVSYVVIMYMNMYWNMDIQQPGDLSIITIMLLTMLLQISIVKQHNVELEIDTLKEILDNEREQYLYEKRMIDAINIKCHDLKHQLNSEVKRQMTDDLKMAVDAYERSFKTGNVALDVVLTKKSFSCMDKNIELNCLADGKLLSFMRETDIYSLFGNILDNAIEAVAALSDKDKKIIHLNVERRGGFVCVREENYFGGKLEYLGGIPQTTKVDKGFHGYGMKSIVSIVDSYGGEIRIQPDKDRFVLKIALPAETEE